MKIISNIMENMNENKITEYEQIVPCICNDSKENPKTFSCPWLFKNKIGSFTPIAITNWWKLGKIFGWRQSKDQFCSVFANEPPGNQPDFYPRMESVVNVELSIEMIRKEITSLNPNKSLGPD